MNDQGLSSLSEDFVGPCSPNSEDIVLEGPGDTVPGPLPPSLLAWAEYERDRFNNPKKPASMPRPGFHRPSDKEPQ